MVKNNEMWHLIISNLISIIGFIITFKSMKKTFEYETISHKNSVQLKQINNLPYDILELMNCMISGVVREENIAKKKANMKKISSDLQKIQSKLYAYGSLDSIKIFSKIQETNFAIERQEIQNNNSIIALYILLISQLKYDITGEIVCPEYWFKMSLKDYKNNELNFKKVINEVIDELKLNKSFKCKI